MKTPERHLRGKEIFVQATALLEEERAAYVEEACAGDRELRREVESLLAHHDGASAQKSGTETGHRAFDPDLVVGYQLTQRLGDGGMGEVFEAEQLRPIRRRVAIKVLKRGLETHEVVARFESERQALALMSHPNVARVFEAGSTSDGRPFFAMEFVGGSPITGYCDANRLELPERLSLFTSVCSGVQHAHQRGVIHRDLKASNVLVTLEDGRPVPKVIDFGIAKATWPRLTEKTLVTRAGGWLGTPEFMSPEQAAGSLDVDTRSDVYSLGVLLYELLVGSLPFDSRRLREASPDALRQVIRDEEPTRPSTKVRQLGGAAEEVARNRRAEPGGLAVQLHGDLDWIVMKALEKDRARRYESPASLAADVDRHLANQPVAAGPPSVTYRARKFVRRHRLGVAAGLLVGLSLALGAWGTVRGLLLARQEAEAAQRAARALVGVLEELNPESEEGYARTPREVLERGAVRIRSELEAHPVLQARVLATLGRLYTVLGSYKEARPLLEEAVATQRELLGPNDPGLSASLGFMGWLRLAAGDLALAQRDFEEALAIRRRAFGADSLETARGLSDLGIVQLRRGSYLEASRLFEEALTVRTAALGPNHPLVSDTRYRQAEVWHITDEIDRARDTFRAVLEDRQRRLPAEHPSIGWCLTSLGRVELAAGNVVEAEAHLRRAMEILNTAYGPDHGAEAVPMSVLADSRRLAGDWEGARALAERALEIRRRRLGPDHYSLAFPLQILGWLEHGAGRYEAARELHERQLEIAESALGPDHPTVGWALIGLAATMTELRHFDEARPLLERAAELFEALQAGGERGVGWARSAAGYLARMEGELDRALPLVESAVTILEAQLGTDHPTLVIPLMNLGALLRDRGEVERARPLVERGYELRLRTGGPDHPGHADDLHTLAKLCHREGRIDEASRLYTQALEVTEQLLGSEHPWVTRALADYADLLRGAGRLDAAREIEGRLARR